MCAALPAGNHQAQGVALLGAERLAVLAVGEDDVVETLLDREAPGHRGAVGALGDDPLRAALYTEVSKDRGEQDARPLAAAGHPVGSLDVRHGGPRPLRRAVARALDHVDAGHRRQPLDLGERQDKPPPHEAVDEQSVPSRVDVGNAGMVALEVELRRRDDSVQVLQRRE